MVHMQASRWLLTDNQVVRSFQLNAMVGHRDDRVKANHSERTWIKLHVNLQARILETVKRLLDDQR